MHKHFGQLDCCASSLQRKNTATCNLKDNKLTIGTCELDKKQLKSIAFQFAHDLIGFADNGGKLVFNVYS